MSLILDLQVASTATDLPSEQDFHRWASAATGNHDADYEVTIRVVDIDESQSLNHQYRGKNKPTNVLSFPADLPEELNLPLLGDLVICAPVVFTEADQQRKSPEAHWAHMVVHGILHLRGYDHIDDADALEMEALETQILTALHYPPPYEADQGEDEIP